MKTIQRNDFDPILFDLELKRSNLIFILENGGNSFTFHGKSGLEINEMLKNIESDIDGLINNNESTMKRNYHV